MIENYKDVHDGLNVV